MKKYYLSVTVHKKDGSTYDNPLKLSEVHLIKKILKMDFVANVTVEITECDKYHFDMLFTK